jgi:hypothetical protein
MTLRHAFTLSSAVLVLVLASLPSTALAAPRASSDAQAIASAYADLAVFILNVAAGNDGQAQKPQAEQVYRDEFARQFASGYSQLGSDEQEALTALPLVDQQLQAGWVGLSVEQRNAIRDQWAAGIQEMTPNMDCELFDGLARAQLLPSFGQYEQTNVNRLRQCWHDHPELTRDPAERSSGQNFGNATAGAAGGSHSTFMAMFNANLYSYTASMNSASMGTATYTVTSRP